MWRSGNKVSNMDARRRIPVISIHSHTYIHTLGQPRIESLKCNQFLDRNSGTKENQQRRLSQKSQEHFFFPLLFYCWSIFQLRALDSLASFQTWSTQVKEKKRRRIWNLVSGLISIIYPGGDWWQGLEFHSLSFFSLIPFHRYYGRVWCTIHIRFVRFQ